MSEPDDTESAALQATLPAPAGGGPRRTSPREDGALPHRIGRFEVVAEIGRGGMGVVYRARDPELDRAVAVKLLHPEVIADESSRARLRREAQALARSVHDNVVHVYEIGAEGGRIFVVMELVDGVTLRQWLKTPRTWTEIVDMFLGGAAGLSAAHRAGLVHGDFKPDNVLVAPDGRPRVADFGLARPGAADGRTEDAPATASGSPLASITIAGAIAGTPAYMAPEQFAGGAVDARTDAFAFCVSLYEALYERHPFLAATFEDTRRAVLEGRIEPPARIPPGMPARVRTLIERGLAPRPDDRPRELSELTDALAALRAERPRRRRALSLALFGVAAILSAAALASRPDPDGDHARRSAADGTDDVAAILAASDLPEPLTSPLADDPSGTTIHRLRNGMTLYVSPRRDQPRIQARLVLRVGSAADPEGARGAANLLARVTRNGGARLGALEPDAERPQLDALHEALRSRSADAAQLARLDAAASRVAAPDEYEALLVELGAEAHTRVDRDRTVVSADLPSARLEAWLRLEAERVRAPVFRGFLREVVASVADIQAQRATLPSSTEPLMGVVWRDHPFSHPPAGDPTDLARLPLAAIEQLHADWYVPNNAAIVLVGDVDPATATALVEAAFADWHPRRLPARPTEQAPAVVAPRASANIDHTAAVVWRRPGPGDARRGLWDALIHVLADEIAARCRDAGISIEPLRWDHGVALSTSADAGQVQVVVADVLARVGQRGLDEHQRTAGSESQRLARALVVEDDAALADHIVKSHAEGAPWSETVAVETLTDDAGMRELLRELGRFTIVTAAPDPDPPATVDLPALEAGPVLEPRRSAFAEALLRLPYARQEPQFLIEGRHYAIREGPGGIAIAAQCVGGIERVGVVLDTRDLLAVGGRCSNLTLAALAHFQALGDRATIGASGFGEARIGLRCGGDQAKFSVVALPTTDLADWAADPTAWLDDTAARGKLSELVADWGRVFDLHGRSVELLLLPHDLLDFALYADSPSLVAQLGFDVRPSEPVVLADWRRAAGAEQAFLYCGPRSEAFLAAAPIERARVRPHARELLLRPRPLDRPSVLALHAPDVPTTAFVTLRLRSDQSLPDPAVVEVFEEYLALRLEAELFGSLRRQGVDLDAELWLHVPSTADPLVTLNAEVTVDPARIAEALVALAAALRRPEIDEDLVERARSRVDEELRTHRIAPRDVPATVLEWRHRGLTEDPRTEVWRGLTAVTTARLGELAQQLAALPPVVAVTGDLDAIDLVALEAMAPVERVTREELVQRRGR